MTLSRHIVILLMLLLVVGSAAPVWAQQPPTNEPMGEFVPLEDLPPTEQLPAAPLVIGAYSFVWLAFFVYLASVARRMTTVQREVERLETGLKAGKRG